MNFSFFTNFKSLFPFINIFLLSGSEFTCLFLISDKPLAFFSFSSAFNCSLLTLISSGSVIGFAFGGAFAEKIGRKWTLFVGLGITAFAYLVWGLLARGIEVPPPGKFNPFPVYIYAVFFVKGLGMSLVHVNSFPMVVELSTSKNVGKFTGYYYAASMAAQTVTPILLGFIFMKSGAWGVLPIYSAILIALSAIVFIIFVKNIKANKVQNAKGLEAFADED